MRAYSETHEENMRDQALVREWINSGFLNADQSAPLQAGLSVPLRRTNGVLRAILALFTGLIVGAAVSLTVIVFNIQREDQPVVFGIAAVMCLGVAWLLATKGQLYRCGVEEMLAVMAIVFLTLCLGESRTWDLPSIVVVLAGALGSLVVYAVFGFRYAIVAAAVLTGMAPFALKQDGITERILSLGAFAVIFFLVWRLRSSYSGRIIGEDFVSAQGAAFAGLYLVLNLVIANPVFSQYRVNDGWFYWGTYVLVWIVPALGLWLGIRDRDRLMLDVSGLAALATILTNKSYLGWMRQSWDPILFGAFLMVTAIALRRWLAKGPNGTRNGFSPVRVLESENRAVAASGALSMVVPHAPGLGASQTDTIKLRGGESGGGGASGSF